MKVLTRDREVSSREKLGYELLTTHVDDFEQMSYTTYGIRVLDENGLRLFEYIDISTSREYVESFISMVAGRDVAAIHIADLLEDYLE
jgi:hypothetical protein